MDEKTAITGEFPLMTQAEIADEQAAFSAIELAALDYADAYTELQCDSDNDRQRDYRKALTEMRRVIRAEITRFSRGNRTLTCGPSCTRCGMVCNKGQNIDEQFAQKLAMELECVLLDPVGYWDKAAKVLGDYRDEWEKINPTPLSFMGEPMPVEQPCDTLECNVEYLLDQCKFSVRDMSGDRSGSRSVEDLAGSLTITFLGLQSRLSDAQAALAAKDAEIAALDRSETQLIGERDDAAEYGTKLSDAVSAYFRVPVGEYSNMNDPREEALSVLDGAYITDSDQDRQIATLTAERDAALAASRYETDLCGQALTDLKAMTAERDALRKDAERLDYLAATTTWTHSGDGFYASHVAIGWGDSIKRRPLRAAIDAAMTKNAASPAT